MLSDESLKSNECSWKQSNIVWLSNAWWKGTFKKARTLNLSFLLLGHQKMARRLICHWSLWVFLKVQMLTSKWTTTNKDWFFLQTNNSKFSRKLIFSTSSVSQIATKNIWKSIWIQNCTIFFLIVTSKIKSQIHKTVPKAVFLLKSKMTKETQSRRSIKT